MKKSLWTKEEESILLNNLHLSNAEIANLLNRSSDSINNKKKRMGLNKKYNTYIYKKDEEFKYIKELDNKYLISNYGTVINKDGIELKQFIMKSKNKKSKGYKIIKFTLPSNETKTFRIHRLVAKYFVPKLDKKDFVNHKDGDSLNNHYSNLEWCTCKENSNHAIQTNLFNPIQNNKLTEEDVEKICEYLTICNPSESLRSISKLFNIHEETLRRIYRHKSWLHITTKYQGKFVKLKYIRNI